jgi:hypothetical protein
MCLTVDKPCYLLSSLGFNTPLQGFTLTLFLDHLDLQSTNLIYHYVSIGYNEVSSTNIPWPIIMILAYPLFRRFGQNLLASLLPFLTQHPEARVWVAVLSSCPWTFLSVLLVASLLTQIVETPKSNLNAMPFSWHHFISITGFILSHLGRSISTPLFSIF